MSHQVFLGGASGLTTWRRDVAIPALEAAAVTFYDPQLPYGAWTPDREAEEMRAKDDAQVLLFVVNHETRGVATVAEVAYYMGLGRQLALSVTAIPPAATLYGATLPRDEIDDLNRGRIFLRTMAAKHNIPVFESISEAVRHAIRLARPTLDLPALRAILHDIQFGDCAFHAEPFAGAFLLRIANANFAGRQWHIEAAASRAEVVRTALKAALTWQEHEARELFTYRGKPVHGPHFDI